MLGLTHLTAAASTGTNTFFLYIYPIFMMFVALLAGLGGWAAYHVHWKKKTDVRHDHDRRVAATCDAVLGSPADLNTGRPEYPGLVRDMSDLKLTVGHMNGTGMTLVDLGEKAVKLAEKTSNDLTEHIKHVNRDEQHFASLEARVTGIISGKGALNE